jgi:hypothetical protein
MTSRIALYTLLGIALLAWIGLLLFTHFVPPLTMPAFLTFFVILLVALTSTFTPLAYLVGYWVLAGRNYRVTVRQSIRESALLALVIILNLILRALHSWNPAMAIVLLVAAIVVEVLALVRK